LADARAAIIELNFLPDLIISDYRLNESATGIDAITELRQLVEKDVPALIISGDTDPRLLEKIHDEDYFLLHKPVRIDKLRTVIGSLLKHHNNSRL